MERLTRLIYGAEGPNWAVANLEHDPQEIIDRLAAYEDTGLEPEDIKELCTDDVAEIAKLFRHMIEDGSIDHLQELLEAEKDGRLVVLPFVAMVEQSLQEGKMTPERDQRFNGRYAVVYKDHKKWKLPLIDICGKRKYDKTEAENRMKELTSQEAEEALMEDGNT